MKPELTKIFDDLDMYRRFCIRYGHVFNEKDLYKKNRTWGLMLKKQEGGRVLDMWKEDKREWLKKQEYHGQKRR